MASDTQLSSLARYIHIYLYCSFSIVPISKTEATKAMNHPPSQTHIHLCLVFYSTIMIYALMISYIISLNLFHDVLAYIYLFIYLLYYK